MMKVEGVRRATDDELPEHWSDHLFANPVVLVMENGDRVMAAQDPELNGPGHLLGLNDEGEYFDFAPSGEAGDE